ncbi:exodeoxyribonuclease III [uncultured Gammaproteobacteria bacterium]
MKIATWNVNSIRARLPLVLAWLEQARPDVLLLQEIKCETPAFPREPFEQAGWHCAVAGQKGYHGVAILAREPLAVVLDRLPGEAEDTQARYLEATVAGVRIASLYLPNGNPADSEKFPYKLRWLERLHRRTREVLAEAVPLVLGGDFNVIPEAEDVYDPTAWAGDALFRTESRRGFRALLNLGLIDALRTLQPHYPGAPPAYTFWDYQSGCWPRNLGLRIDHFLLSPQAADRLLACTIDQAPRGWDKASDHTPVVLTLVGGA